MSVRFEQTSGAWKKLAGGALESLGDGGKCEVVVVLASVVGGNGGENGGGGGGGRGKRGGGAGGWRRGRGEASSSAAQRSGGGPSGESPRELVLRPKVTSSSANLAASRAALLLWSRHFRAKKPSPFDQSAFFPRLQAQSPSSLTASYAGIVAMLRKAACASHASAPFTVMPWS